MTLIVIQPDTHIPHQHVRAVDAFLAFLADRQPEQVHQIGDLIDMEAPSRWTTGTLDEDGRKLQREIDGTHAFLRTMRSAFHGRYTFQPGNHDIRLETYCRTKARALFGLADLDLGKVLRFEEYKVEQVADLYQIAPRTIAFHGDKLALKGGMSVHKELDRFHQNVVIGHCHRQAVVYRQTGAGRMFGVESGHLSDQRKAAYLGIGVGAADWSLGFAYLWVEGSNVTPGLVPISPNGSFTFDGRKYS